MNWSRNEIFTNLVSKFVKSQNELKFNCNFYQFQIEFCKISIWIQVEMKFLQIWYQNLWKLQMNLSSIVIFTYFKSNFVKFQYELMSKWNFYKSGIEIGENSKWT